MTEQRFDVKDLALTDQGVSRTEWALQEMPLVRGLMQQFEREQPLQDIRTSGCLYIATLKLQAMELNTDRLTDEQQAYLSSWEEGT